MIGMVKFKLLVILALLSPCIQVKANRTGFLDKIVPNPIRKLFAHEEKKNDTTIEKNENLTEDKIIENDKNETTPTKEHGQLDFFGRELVKQIGKTIDVVGDKLKISSTKGLDANKTFFGDIASNFKDRVRAIYPGTLWCGDGAIAKSPEELGYFKKVDSCCRDHDKCPDNVPAGEVRESIENSGIFTRSHCDCDEQFYNCLKAANSIVSNKIGFTYFSVLGPQCFKMEYPVVDCKETSWGRCVNYTLNSSEVPFLQWFDNPTY